MNPKPLMCSTLCVVVTVLLSPLLLLRGIEPLPTPPSRADATNSSHFFGNGKEQEPAYTEHDFRHDFASINRWALSHWKSAYAGCYLDPAHGGRLRVGFTEAQDQRLQEVKELPGLLKPERVTMFRFTPTHPWVELHHLEEAVIEMISGSKAYGGLITSLSLEVPRNLLSVEATKVVKVRKRVIELFGRAAPIKVTYGATPVEL